MVKNPPANAGNTLILETLLFLLNIFIMCMCYTFQKLNKIIQINIHTKQVFLLDNLPAKALTHVQKEKKNASCL